MGKIFEARKLGVCTAIDDCLISYHFFPELLRSLTADLLQLVSSALSQWILAGLAAWHFWNAYKNRIRGKSDSRSCQAAELGPISLEYCSRYVVSKLQLRLCLSNSCRCFECVQWLSLQKSTLLQIKEVLDLFHEDLTKDNMANASSVQAYVTAVRAARQADKKTLSKIFKSKANKDIRLVKYFARVFCDLASFMTHPRSIGDQTFSVEYLITVRTKSKRHEILSLRFEVNVPC